MPWCSDPRFCNWRFLFPTSAFDVPRPRNRACNTSFVVVFERTAFRIKDNPQQEAVAALQLGIPLNNTSTIFFLA